MMKEDWQMEKQNQRHLRGASHSSGCTQPGDPDFLPRNLLWLLTDFSYLPAFEPCHPGMA
jgi:hypothetical protein